MKKTLNIFMYKGLVCGHCRLVGGEFDSHPSTTNPPSANVATANTGITKEAKEFIKSNYATSDGEFSFVKLIHKDEKDLISLVGFSDVFLLNLGAYLSITLSNDSDINIIDKIDVLDSYAPPKGVIMCIDNCYNQLAAPS